jgi:3-mercaptopyruvate sulfurtransferase SseA
LFWAENNYNIKKLLHICSILMMRFTISTSELKSLYLEKRDDLLVIDARPYSDYALGHLPNAVNIDLVQFHWIDTSKEGISQFNKQMKILLSNIGVTNLWSFMTVYLACFLREVSGY